MDANKIYILDKSYSTQSRSLPLALKKLKMSKHLVGYILCKIACEWVRFRASATCGSVSSAVAAGRPAAAAASVQ